MKLQVFLFTTIAAFAMSCGSEKKDVADLVVLGGRIYTADAQNSSVQAVAVKGDTIAFTGSEEEARKYMGEETQVIDLQGKIMTPGFIEGHGHLMGVGYNELQLDLMAVKSYDEIVAKVKEAVSKAKPGQWIVGRGWHQDKWDHKPDKMIRGFQTHDLLSQVSPNNPVFLRHASGHLGIANAKAMEIAGVNQLSIEKIKQNLNQQGGEVILDELGNPTGIFNERAMGLIARHIPDNNSESDSIAIELAFKACLRNGLTGFHDAGAGKDQIEFYEKLKNENRLGVRLYVMAEFDPSTIYQRLKKGPEIDPNHFLTVRSIKLHCDGALGSRGAWLLEPYSDRKDFYGMATLPMDTVLKISRAALQAGFQVCSHAIGDRANREILDRYEQAFKDDPAKAADARFRIEHAQHISRQDLPRFAQLGVIPAMQAIHMSSDRPWAIDRLGEQRIKEGAYMWQTLLKSGARIVNGTDAPVEPLNPIPCFYASVTRKTLKGEPKGGYEPEERMSRQQALKSYTIDAAFGAFEENIKGSIEKGKLADFTVFTKDLMEIPEEEILSTEVAMTILGGKVVYKK